MSVSPNRWQCGHKQERRFYGAAAAELLLEGYVPCPRVMPKDYSVDVENAPYGLISDSPETSYKHVDPEVGVHGRLYQIRGYCYQWVV